MSIGSEKRLFEEDTALGSLDSRIGCSRIAEYALCIQQDCRNISHSEGFNKAANPYEQSEHGGKVRGSDLIH
jgi:hypothetical protein